jgi:hypothetical protein
MTINVIPRWKDGPPDKFEAGQFVVYSDGECQLIGWNGYPQSTHGIVKHTTLIEPHELDWLQSMAVKRCLGELK